VPPRINRINSAALKPLFPSLSDTDIDNLIWRLSNYSSEVSLALPLILLTDPLFVKRDDGAVDMLFELDGRQMTFPEISRHFESIYAPAYLTRIALPREPDQAYVDALNQAVRRSHALYGGYTAQPMVLPAPLQPLPQE
jgi:hypothetical protein